MKNILLSVVIAMSMFAPIQARALTLPDLGRTYFVGTTEELWLIFAGISHVAGYEAEAWTFPSAYTHQHRLMGDPPWGLGENDCMISYSFPGMPYDTTTPFLGMSTTVVVNGVTVGVEIPALEDLADQTNWPGECYGYEFYRTCVNTWLPEANCPDPE